MTVDPDIPRRVAQARHDIEDLYALQTTANDVLNTLQPEPLAVRRVLADPPRRVGMADVWMYEQTLLQGQQRRLASRIEEVQQTLDLHGGRLDRIEDNQRRQSEQLAGLSDQLAEVLTVLRGLGPSD